ncbi:MAG: DUF5050 domain-containing protein [Christensenellales bacterium]
MKKLTKAAALVMLLCSVLLSGCTEPGTMQEIKQPNMAGKSQYGYYFTNRVTSQEDWVVFATQDNLIKINGQNVETSEKFCRVRLPESVQVQGEWAYYLITGASDIQIPGLHKVKMDRMGKHTILEDEKILSYLVYGDQIYYITQGGQEDEPSDKGLMVCSLEGENPSTVYEGCVSRFYIFGSTVYLAVESESGTALVQLNLDTGESRQVYEHEDIAEWVVGEQGQALYCFIKKMELGSTVSAQIVKVTAATSEAAEVFRLEGENFSQQLREIAYFGGSIYYINGKKLMQLNPGTKELRQIYTELSFSHYYIEGSEIYVELDVYFILQNKLELYRLRDQKKLVSSEIQF